jgi:hypothetical protein
VTLEPISKSLDPRERARLSELEAIVREGLRKFIEVGNALLEIRDARLYREQQETFEDYLRDSWNMRRSRGYQLIDAARLSTVVDSAGLPAPANERQARELLPLLREDENAVIDVWQDMLDKYGDKITAKRLRDIVDERLRGEQRVRSLVSRESDEWYTPSRYVQAAKQVLGGIDLDPASSAIANETVRARRFYTGDDDGLTKSWRGRVWLNPPFRLAGEFIKKLIAEFDAGRVTAAIAVANGMSFPSAWFLPLFDYPICLTNHRVQFENPLRENTGSQPTGTAFVYFGHDFDSFVDRFSEFGRIVKDPSGREWQRRFSEPLPFHR